MPATEDSGIGFTARTKFVTQYTAMNAASKYRNELPSTQFDASTPATIVTVIVGSSHRARSRRIAPAFQCWYVAGIDTSDVTDNEIGRVGRILRDELVVGKKPFQLAAEEEIDPHEQDRRHDLKLARSQDGSCRRATGTRRGRTTRACD